MAEERTLLERYIAARTKFAPVVKDRQSDQFGGYRYASYSDIAAAVVPALAKQGLALLQSSSVDLEGGTVEIVTHIAGGMEGEELAFGGVIIPIADNPALNRAQAVGAALSYARRYGLLIAAGVDSEDPREDVDQQPVAAATAKAKPSAKEDPNDPKNRRPCNLGTPDCKGTRFYKRDSCQGCYEWIENEREAEARREAREAELAAAAEADTLEDVPW